LKISQLCEIFGYQHLEQKREKENMTAKKRTIPIILLSTSLFLTACSYRYLNGPFGEYADATDLVGKNAVYCFEQLQKEEINLRIAEAVKKPALKPDDLKPQVLSNEQIELRRQLIAFITDYAGLLESIVIKDFQPDIKANTGRIKADLENIGIIHKEYLNPQEIGIITTLAAAIPEALTAVRNRDFLLKLMTETQPLLEKFVKSLKSELILSKEMIDNFFSRQFMLTAAAPWPDKEASREKYAKIGAKLLERQQEIDVIFTDLIAALDTVTASHAELHRLIKTNKSPLRSLVSLIDYAARIEAMYQEYSLDETDKKKKK
jgi:hypothetical protein